MTRDIAVIVNGDETAVGHGMAGGNACPQVNVLAPPDIRGKWMLQLPQQVKRNGNGGGINELTLGADLEVVVDYTAFAAERPYDGGDVRWFGEAPNVSSPNQSRLGKLCRECLELGQMLRFPPVVRVKEGDVSTTGLTDAAVTRAAHSAIVLVDESDARFPLHILLHKRRPVVDRTVIDDNDFIVLKFLIQNRIKRLLNEGPFVIEWNDNAEKWGDHVWIAPWVGLS